MFVKITYSSAKDALSFTRVLLLALCTNNLKYVDVHTLCGIQDMILSTPDKLRRI